MTQGPKEKSRPPSAEEAERSQSNGTHRSRPLTQQEHWKLSEHKTPKEIDTVPLYLRHRPELVRDYNVQF
jgi:hypothetical protein